MYIGPFVGLVCAILFFRAADYERLGSWGWSIASLGLTVLASWRGGDISILLLVQAALFGLMWWYNVRRRNRRVP